MAGPLTRSNALLRVLLVGTVVGAGCTGGQAGVNPSKAPSPSGIAQAVITIGSRPAAPVAGAGAVWVPNTGDGTVSKIDPKTNTVVATLHIGDQLAFYHRDCEQKGSVHSFMVTSFHVRDCDLPSAVATGGGALWVLKNDDKTVLRIDPSTLRVVARVALGFVPFDMTASDRAVWITGYWEDQLVRIDPSTNQIVARLTVPDGAGGIAVSDQAVWVASTIAGEVLRIDPATNRVVATVGIDCPTTCYQGSLPLALAATADTVWVRTLGDALLDRIDATTNRVVAMIDASFSLGRNGLDHLALLEGSVWVCGPSLLRVDPQTNRVAATAGVTATTVTAGFGSLWVTDIDGRIERIDPSAARPSAG